MKAEIAYHMEKETINLFLIKSRAAMVHCLSILLLLVEAVRVVKAKLVTIDECNHEDHSANQEQGNGPENFQRKESAESYKKPKSRPEVIKICWVWPVWGEQVAEIYH